MSLNWTRTTPTTRRASANGREYRILSNHSRFILRINDVEQRFNDAGRTRASLTECMQAAEADAKKHEGEQRPDPTSSPSGSPVPSTPTSDDAGPTVAPSAVPSVPVRTNHPGTDPDPFADDDDDDDDPTPHDTGLPDPDENDPNAFKETLIEGLVGSAVHDDRGTYPNEPHPVSSFEPVSGSTAFGRTVYTDGVYLRVGLAPSLFQPSLLFTMMSRGEARRLRKSLHRSGHGRLAAVRRQPPVPVQLLRPYLDDSPRRFVLMKSGGGPGNAATLPKSAWIG